MLTKIVGCLCGLHDVLESWGFRYVTNFVWVKNSLESDTILEGNTKSACSVKGNLKPIKRNVSSVLSADKRRHSQKPKRETKSLRCLTRLNSLQEPRPKMGCLGGDDPTKLVDAQFQGLPTCLQD